jgi:hypothetical protein
LLEPKQKNVSQDTLLYILGWAKRRWVDGTALALQCMQTEIFPRGGQEFYFKRAARAAAVTTKTFFLNCCVAGLIVSQT